MEIIEGGGGVPWFKGGAFGEAGTGKTTTGVVLGNGIIDHFKLSGDFYFFDTEKGSEYVNALSKVGGRYGIKGTGKNLKICKSRTFSDLMAFIDEAEKRRAAFLMVDSITHVRDEIMSSMLEQVNKELERKGKNKLLKLEFHHTAKIAEMMAKLSARYLNSELHFLINGRSQNMWRMEENEETGKRDLVNIGKKMKAGNDMAYEPSLLYEMEVVRDKTGNAGARRVCTIWKDRFGLLDGMQVENPTFDFFKPYIQLLTPNAVDVVDTVSQTPLGVNDDGSDEWHRERRQRLIASENLAGLLTKEWPGASASDKWCKGEAVFKVLGTRSWAEVENTDSNKVKAACEAFAAAAAEVKKELAEREAKEAQAEAEAKAAKKGSAKKAEEVKA